MSFIIGLIIIGLVIGFGAFVFAAMNMFRGTIGKNQFSGFNNMFKKHLGAMIAMAFGGLLFAIGIILTVANILHHGIR